MLLLANPSDLANQLTSRLEQLSRLLFADLGDPVDTLSLAPGDALSGDLPSGHWAQVKVGEVHAQRLGANVIQYDAEDMLALPRGYGLPDLHYTASAATTLALYPMDQVLRHLHANKQRAAQWTAYLLTQISVFQQAITQTSVENQSASTGFLQFSAGDTIIREGDVAGEVYHIVHGHADVYRAGVAVGEVLPGELFGAMAMLCNSPRTATVIARDEVMVAAVPEEDFQGLIQQHPETAVTLMKNMARAINDLNARLQDVRQEQQ